MQVTQKLSKKWLFGLIALIAFGISGSLVLLSITMKAEPNLVDKDYYEKGRKFETTILQQMEARRALGWDMQLNIPSTTKGDDVTYIFGSSGTYLLFLKDRSNLPLQGAHVTLFGYRPSDSRADFKVVMYEVAAGNYQATLTFPQEGAWTLTAQARLDKNVSEVVENVYVLPPQ